MTAWHVYQFHNDTELLYVGYTRYLKKRISQHRCLKSWWPEVAEIVTEEFATEDAARQREKEIWATGRPKYNRHNPFLTPEEEYDHSPKGRAHRRQYSREYEKRPERQAQKRKQRQSPEYQAWERGYKRLRSRSRRWQQTGPGLF